jgi:threonine/homoserine/homoserine lactone efflux protein
LIELILFLAKVVGISLSGVMAPGPVTAAAIAMGARNRFAGALMAIGHGIVEFPLMILIILGMDTILRSTTTKIVIGFAGGAFLLFMAILGRQSVFSNLVGQCGFESCDCCSWLWDMGLCAVCYFALVVRPCLA